MASKTAHSLPETTRKVLDGITQQFHLTDDKLLDITKVFVGDFSLGLSNYSKAMAMM